MSVNYVGYWMHDWWYQLSTKTYGRQICGVVDKFSSSAKFGVYIPEFNRWFQYYILHITGSYFSSSLVFNVKEVFVTLNLDNPISRSPFEVPFARLLFFEIYSVILSWRKVVSCPWSFVQFWNDSHPKSSWQWLMWVFGPLSSAF